jgi:hypothetical protein
MHFNNRLSMFQQELYQGHNKIPKLQYSIERILRSHFLQYA